MPQGECNELHPRLRHSDWLCPFRRFPVGGSPKRARNRSAAPMRCSRSRRCKASTRCGPLRAGERNHPNLGGARDRPCSLQSAREGFPHRQDRREHDLRRVPTRATGYRASLRKRARQNQALVELLRSVGGRRGVTPAQTRSPGRSPGSRGSCRCLARGSSTASMRIWGRPPSRSPPAISTKSIALRRRSRFRRRLSRRDLEAVRSLGRSPVRQGAHSGFSSPRSASRWRRVKNGSSRARPSAAYSAVSARRFRGGTAQRASIRKFQQEY